VSTPEGKVKKQVKALLKQYGAYYHMPVQTGYGAPTLDFIGCYRGRYFGIETKAPGKKPTPRQELTMAMINEAGGAVFVIDSEPDELEAWLLLQR
jgi:penicillin-binding protein-related factor A (putative recombinase)